MVRWHIFLCIFRKVLCIRKKRWPLHKNTLKLMKFFLWLLRYRDSHNHNVRFKNEFWCILGHPNPQPSILIQGGVPVVRNKSHIFSRFIHSFSSCYNTAHECDSFCFPVPLRSSVKSVNFIKIV
jgi:hypothetical protein